MRGQIFALDAFLTVLLFTVMLGFLVMQFERIESRADNLNYLELETLANDWSQIGVKNVLVIDNYTLEMSPDLTPFDAQIAGVITPPLSYEIDLTTINHIDGNSGCSGKQNTAVATRLVYVSGAQQNFTVKICA